MSSTPSPDRSRHGAGGWPGRTPLASYRNAIGPGVLLVEDDPDYAMLIRSVIDETPLAELGFGHVGLLGEACDYVQEVGAGCVLLDLSLPDAAGLEGIERLRTADPDLPIVVLTGREDDALAAEAVSAGAQDYLLKRHVDGYQLAHAVRYAIERQRRQSEHSEELLHDPLTGLPTGPLLADRLEVAISRAKRRDSGLAVLLVDVEDLGEINRRYGRDTGSAVVTEVARRLLALLPHASLACSGTRFFLLCEDLESAPQAMTLASQLGAELRVAGFEAGTVDVHPQLSIGVGVGGGGVNPGALVDAAVAAMGRLTAAWPPVPGEGPRQVEPIWKAQIRVLRHEIDSALEYGLCLDEIGVLLDSKALGEEIRDAAWLYAWALLKERAEGRNQGPRYGSADD